jgi:hypothetical protein
MPRNKSIPRVRTTPRLIRDIKPKRQLPRNQISNNNDDWWLEDTDQTSSDGNGGDVLTYHSYGGSSTNGPPERPPVVGCNGGTHQRCRPYWKNKCCDSWDRYKRTSCRKKMKQFFWTFILFRTLKIIYLLDLENYSLSKWQLTETFGSKRSGISGAQSLMNFNPTTGKRFFSEEDLAEAALYSPNVPSQIWINNSFQTKPDAPLSVLGRFSRNFKSMSSILVQSFFSPSRN